VRLAGAAVLLLVLLLQAGLGPALLERPRLALFDLYARLLPRPPDPDPAVMIVAIDEASLAAVGQWPWPRTRMAELVRRILAAGPAALGIDLLWPEPDRLSPARWAAGEPALPEGLAAGLAALPDHDAVLAAALKAGPVVVAVAGERDRQPGQGGPAPMVLARGGDPYRWLPAYDGLLRSLPALDGAAPGHGLVSVDKSVDGLVRRLPLVSGIDGKLLMPSLSLEMLRLALGARRIDLQLDPGGMRSVGLGRFAVPVAPDGFAWLHLAPPTKYRYVSAADLLAGTVPPARLQRKLVLLGITGLGLQDQHATPLGPMWGIELHAQLLENVVQGRLPAQPRRAPWAELGLTLLLGLALILLLPAVRLRWYPLAAILPLLLLAGAGLAAWHWKLWLIDVAAPAAGGGVVYVALLGGGLAEAQAQRRALRRALEEQKLRDARIAGELDAARRIQLGILPRPDSVAGDPRFQLDAAIAPAREVGGDLYDFFTIDERTLFVMIGDVSGKGVPASLFMALGKALYKSCVLRGERDIGTVMAAANAEISRDNVESMFITLFAGLLDLETGELAFCNAGHDAPFLLAPPGAPRDLDNVGGPPIGVVEDFPYMTEQHRLQPGELLVLTTDGVTEAMNPAGALLGRPAAAAALAALPGGAGAPEAVAALRAAVAGFAAGAEPSDDVTLLAVAWRGPPASSAARPFSEP
jgi:serine phosphatase RsbU (regulator of sigma subunit)/CHASE2 domain-containing sensor protein